MTGFFRRKKKEKRGEKISATILLISGNLFFFLIKQDNKSTFQFQYQNPGLKKKTSYCD